jgi:hypothetical protein
MYTPLHIAVQHRQPRVVQTLLGYGANVHLKGGRVSSVLPHKPITNIMLLIDRCANASFKAVVETTLGLF